MIVPLTICVFFRSGILCRDDASRNSFLGWLGGSAVPIRSIFRVTLPIAILSGALGAWSGDAAAQACTPGITSGASVINCGSGIEFFNTGSVPSGTVVNVTGDVVFEPDSDDREFISFFGTLNMQNGSATDSVTINDIDPSGARFRFDFNGATGESDFLIARGLHAGTGNQIFINVIGGDPTAQGAAPLLRASNLSAPAVPDDPDSVAAPTRYAFGAGGDPTNANTRYVLIERSTVNPDDPYFPSFTSYDLFLLYYPQGSGPTAPEATTNFATASAQAEAFTELTGDVIDMAQGVSGVRVNQITPLFGVWASGKLGRSSHDGFQATSRGAGGTTVTNTAAFDTSDYSLFASAQLDLGRYLGIADYGLKVGMFGGWARTDVDLKTNAILAAGGIFDAGDAVNDSAIFGSFALVTKGSAYAMGTIMGSSGETDVNNKAIVATSNYDTSGVIVSLVAGNVFPVKNGSQEVFGDNISFDARLGVSYQYNQADSHADSQANQIGEGELEYVKGLIAGNLFTSFVSNGVFYVPYVQVGYEYRFDDSNSVVANAVLVDFTDDEDMVFGVLGLKAQASKNLEFNVSLQGRTNEDQEAISGQLGATWHFD